MKACRFHTWSTSTTNKRNGCKEACSCRNAKAMDTTDTESIEDESEHPQQPYVDIEAVNSTLTEVHQQYNNLLLKYSNALNIIDELKCQLACGVNKEIAGGWSESNALELRKDVRYLKTDIKPEPLPPVPSKRNSKFVTLRQSGDHISRERAILCASDVGSLPPLEHGQVGLLSTGVSTFPPESNLREARRIEPDCQLEALGEPASSCTSVILDPTNEFVSYTAPPSRDDTPKFSSPPCTYDSTRRGSSSHKKTASVQRKYHQVAVVYPAQRSAELCTVGCCVAHSCCCCSEQKKSIHHQMDSSCCFNAGLDTTLTHFSRKCLCTPNGFTTSLFKISSALDIALKLAAELRKNSSSLLQQL